MWFASNGYVCLVIDTLQLGEIAGMHHGTYDRDSAALVVARARLHAGRRRVLERRPRHRLSGEPPRRGCRHASA